MTVTNTAITAEGLAHFSDADLADLLADPDLNSSIRDLIIKSRPEAVADFAKDCAMQSNVYPGGTCDPRVAGSTGRDVWRSRREMRRSTSVR